MNIDTETLQRVAAGLRYGETRWQRMDALCDPDDGAPGSEVDMMDGWVDGYAAAIASIIGGVTGPEVRGIVREEIGRAADLFQTDSIRRAAADEGIAHRLHRLVRG